MPSFHAASIIASCERTEYPAQLGVPDIPKRSPRIRHPVGEKNVDRLRSGMVSLSRRLSETTLSFGSMSAQLGKSLGLAGRQRCRFTRIGGGQDPSASREHRDDIRRIRTHGARREATNPTTEGRVRQAVWQIFPKPTKRMAPQVGLESTCKHQPKDLASTAGKSKSL